MELNGLAYFIFEDCLVVAWAADVLNTAWFLWNVIKVQNELSAHVVTWRISKTIRVDAFFLVHLIQLSQHFVGFLFRLRWQSALCFILCFGAFVRAWNNTTLIVWFCVWNLWQQTCCFWCIVIIRVQENYAIFTFVNNLVWFVYGFDDRRWRCWLFERGCRSWLCNGVNFHLNFSWRQRSFFVHWIFNVHENFALNRLQLFRWQILE